mgnify:CR=1 FL=1
MLETHSLGQYYHKAVIIGSKYEGKNQNLRITRRNGVRMKAKSKRGTNSTINFGIYRNSWPDGDICNQSPEKQVWEAKTQAEDDKEDPRKIGMK